jgi:hypothetical protein
MGRVTDGATVNSGRGDSEPSAEPSLESAGVEYNFAGSAAVAALIGAGLAWPARSGALELLIAIAAAQALFTFAWVFVMRIPGRKGAIVIAALTAGAADTAVSVWPHSRLGTLLAVFALAVPVLFVHQLMRGVARVRIVESLSGIAILVIAVVALPALLQLRHEFVGRTAGADVTFGVIVVAAGALLVGYCIDLVYPAPRFDADVPRGLLAVIGSAAVGAALGQLTLRDSPEFIGGRAVFLGAALGALVALFAVAAAFIEQSAPVAEAGFARRARPVISVLLPLSVLAPIAFLLCLAVRA